MLLEFQFNQLRTHYLDDENLDILGFYLFLYALFCF